MIHIHMYVCTHSHSESPVSSNEADSFRNVNWNFRTDQIIASRHINCTTEEMKTSFI